jgi:hypothetical protein
MSRFPLAVLVLALSVPTAALAADAPVARATIVDVRKEHNVDTGGGALSLRLTARVETTALQGRTLALVAFFHDGTGQPIRSVLSGWADATGQVRAMSKDVTTTANPEALDFMLTVPYGAFPTRPDGKYQVEARLRLIERTPTGRIFYASRSVWFWVEG